ncbi:ribose-5-phosphate isomerase RpiA [Marinilongibacter aquaticus]|uniref:ribose-5-phosphate isomerase RpiA n=1 Tax=Marinilongibacter aquaticus TaxID=2975157 RepID=UPI0021BDA3CF|nr:ribose-5-phosphate isomerase RpiA [Marinilongibacter aquaticus]UBM58356.1 ribose-5-phosphate isomerase RpiA [Marinilongibacter aquaticus]
MSVEREKEIAAIASLKYVENGMVLGLGTGSTVAYMLDALAEKVRAGLKIVGVPSSYQTELRAKELGIPLVSLDDIDKIDLNIDGADEFDPNLHLIKGGGGALLKEKIIAHNSKQNIIIADSKKQVDRLGHFKLPVEVVKFAAAKVKQELEGWALNPVLRVHNNTAFLTDEQNYILDLDISKVDNLEELEQKLKSIPGLVETGLFLTYAHSVMVGTGQSYHTFTRET